MIKTSKVDTAACDFIEGMGQLFEADGFARIAGRILGSLMLSAEPRSLQDLSDALQVSRASVSINTRLLEQLGALERVTLPGDRRDYYRIAEDVQDRMLDIRMKRFQETRRLLTAAKQTNAVKDARVRHRLQQFSSFYRQLEDVISQTKASWAREAKQGSGGAQRKNR